MPDKIARLGLFVNQLGRQTGAACLNEALFALVSYELAKPSWIVILI